MEERGRAGAKLDSWKEIAAYLGREVRTAQRWEKLEGLPVHRLGHRKLGSVFAYPHELDAWLTSRRVVPPGAPQEVREEPEPDTAQPATVEEATLAPEPAIRLPGASLRGWPGWVGAAAAGAIAIAVILAGWHPHPRASTAAVNRSAPTVQNLFAAATAEGGALRLLHTPRQAGALALARGGEELYAADDNIGQGGHTITVFDTRALRPVATLPVADAPYVLAATPDGSRVFATGPYSNGLHVIDTATRRDAWIALDGGVTDLAPTADGGALYLAMSFDGLARLDLRTMEITHLATSACPVALALAPGGRTLYVGYQCGGPAGHRGRDSIGIFDTVTQRFTGTLAGQAPMVATALAVTPDGNELWSSAGNACVAAEYDHTGCPAGFPGLVYVFNTSSGKLLGRIPLDWVVTQIRFLAGGTRALLDGALLDTTRREVVERLPDTVTGTAITGDGARLYLSIAARDGVAVFDIPHATCLPPADDLVAWWAASGTTADSHGMLAGQAVGGLKYAPAPMGQGFALDGAAAVNFGHDAAITPSWPPAFSLAAWVRADATPGTMLQRQETDGKGWHLGLDAAGKLEACFSGSPCLHATTAWPLHTWHLVELSGNGHGDLTLHVDGALAARGRAPTQAAAPGADLIAGTGFRGEMEDILYYSQPLNAASRQALLGLPACIAQENGEPPSGRSPISKTGS